MTLVNHTIPHYYIWCNDSYQKKNKSRKVKQEEGKEKLKIGTKIDMMSGKEKESPSAVREGKATKNKSLKSG